MSDVTPSAEACEVDPDLMRRVAWGMIAGKSKAEIAKAEELTEEECETVCTAPGMFSIMNVWVNFLERRKEGGRRNARKLTGWCVDHVFQHAPERLNRNEVWRLDRLSSVMLYYGFAVVFGWMLGFLDGVLGVPGTKRRELGEFKQNLVDLLCWAIEVTFREKMLEQYSVELLIAKDGAFQAAIAGREYFELGMGGERRTGEKAGTENRAENSAAACSTTGASLVPTSGEMAVPPSVETEAVSPVTSDAVRVSEPDRPKTRRRACSTRGPSSGPARTPRVRKANSTRGMVLPMRSRSSPTGRWTRHVGPSPRPFIHPPPGSEPGRGPGGLPPPRPTRWPVGLQT